MWLDLRSEGGWYYVTDLLAEYSKLTNRTERTVRRWLNAGEGMLWDYGLHDNKRSIYLIGKKRVMKYFDLPIPGRVILVDREDLFGSLQRLRATLSTTWMNGKEKAFCSRAIIEQKIGKTHQTQLNYEKHTKQKKKAIISDDMKSEYGGDWKQFPNRYYAVNYAKYYRAKKQHHRWDFYPVGDQKWSSVAGYKKVLYDSLISAKNAIANGLTDFALALDNNQATILTKC